MKYREIGRVCETYLGTPVCLVLNVRLNVPREEFCALSWRSRYITSPGRNRRYYWTRADGFWSIPTWLAETILGRALGEGLLASEYDDQERRHGGVENGVFFDSRDMSVADRRRLFHEITFSSDHDLNWGPDPIFIVSEMADCSWRKIMIVDTLGKTCTFRSTTTDPTYPLKDSGRRNGRWFLDRSMQDASAALMRQFLTGLRALERSS